ncbi:MAG: mechanosensitive ion channel [Cephaloticoccus sp.]|nr:mechanosensitive ion channel [Cephaloticoccus sp.]MCF7761864.1 mechanosensitive ion channel [Cephaloticoccus sp.]
MELVDTQSLNTTLVAMQNWLATEGLAFGIKLLGALVIFIIGKWLARVLSAVLSRALERAKLDATLNKFVTRIANVLLLLVVIMAALDMIGVRTTSLVAIIGAAGLAVGLALQGSLANFAAGVMIIIFRPFKIGDFIDAGGIKGIVEEISIFTTNLRTPDNLAVIVPNAAITGGSITNFAAKENRRIDLTFGIAYDDDIKVAKKAIWGVLKTDERILQDPAPIVGVMELADSSVNLVVWPWVKRTDFLTVKMDLNENIKAAIEQAGCSIPFPQRDVHLHAVQAAGN